MQQIEMFDKGFHTALSQGNYGYAVDTARNREYRIVSEPEITNYVDSDGEAELHLIVQGRLYTTSAIAEVENEDGECFSANLVVTQTMGSEVEKPWTFESIVSDFQ